MYQQSVFSRIKKSPKGIKNGAIELEVSPRGGYRKPLQPDKEDSNKLLNQILLKQNKDSAYHFQNVREYENKQDNQD